MEEHLVYVRALNFTKMCDETYYFTYICNDLYKLYEKYSFDHTDRLLSESFQTMAELIEKEENENIK